VEKSENQVGELKGPDILESRLLSVRDNTSQLPAWFVRPFRTVQFCSQHLQLRLAWRVEDLIPACV
jgi:hypothetical protein